MTLEGDMTIAHLKEALAAHGLKLSQVTNLYNLKNGLPYNIFNKHKEGTCRLILQLRLVNKEKHKMNHCVSFDGTTI